MKKFMALTISMLALIALVVAPATSFAGSCSGHAKTAEAKTADAKKAAAHCSATEAKACADKLGMSVEECQKLCAVHDVYSIN